MQKSLIFFSIFIVTFIAVWNAKDRFQELETVAVKTPAQVEMKPMIQQSGDRKDVDDKKKLNTSKPFNNYPEQINDRQFKNPMNETNKSPGPYNPQFR